MDLAPTLLKEPYQRKFFAKFDKTCSAEGLDVHLTYRRGKLKPERRVYKLTINSRYLLDDSRTSIPMTLLLVHLI